MASPDLFDPSVLKPCWVDENGKLKPSCTTSSYSGGVPGAGDLKPSLLNTDGTLKAGLLTSDGTDLKPSLKSGGFQPHTIYSDNGVSLLRQANFLTTAPTVAGTIEDDATGKASHNAIGGRCYDFDGSNDFCIHAGSLLSSAISALSCFCWIQSTDTSGTFAGEWHVTGSNRRWRIGMSTGGLLEVQLSKNGSFFSSGSKWYVGTTSINDGLMHHVGFTWDAGTLKLFVDGLEETTTKTYDNAFTEIVARTTARFQLGAINNTTNDPYDGYLFDVRPYNQVLLSDEILFLLEFGLAGTDPTISNMLAWYKCDDNHATIAYDSSGNGNDVTKMNITTATFHYIGKNVPWSFLDEVGYTNDSGNLIPRDESDTANDVAGNPLQYSGRAKIPAKVNDSNCVTLDGVDDYISSGVSTSLTSGITVAAWVNPTNFGANRTIWSAGTRMNFRFVASTGALRFTTDGVKDYTSSYIATAGNWIHVCAVFDSNFDVSFYVNGAFVDKITGTAAAASGTSPICFGSRSTAFNLLLGNLCGLFFSESELSASQVLQLYQGSVPSCVLFYPCAEGGGDAVYDVSGNGNHGTIMNATTSPPGTGAWANTQDIYHRNLVHGFELYDDDATSLLFIRVSYTNDGSKITPTISSYTKVRDNDAGIYHNSAESTIDFTGGVNIADSANWETAWAFNDTRTNPLFAGTLTASSIDVRADRMLAYRSTLSGSDLTKVQNYTADKAI